MQNSKISKTIWLCAVLMILSLATSKATTYNSKGATGDPTQLTSWTNSAGANPANFTSGDTFVILNGCNFTIPALGTWTVNATTAGTAATVQINSTGALTFLLGSGQGGTLQLGGNLVQTVASASVGLVGNGTTTSALVEFTSSGTWTGSADTSNAKVGITVDSGVTLDASGATAGFKLRNNTLNITVNGTLNLGKLTVTASGSTGGFILGPSGTLVTATTSANGLPGIFSGFSAGKITLPTTANYVFNGTNVQVTGTAANNATMPTTVNNLIFSNSLGFTLSQATTVNGVLGLTAGKVAGNVTLGSSATISGSSSTAYINGQLTVPFSAPSSVAYTFPVGTASAYSPVSIANFTDAGAGTLTASATATANPNPGSGIDSSLYIARYWTLTGSGFSSPTYDFTGTYVAGDIQNGANPANLIVRKWDTTSSTWSAPASSSSVAYTATGTGFTTSFGQFATGEAQTTMPILDALTKSAITNTSATLGATLENDFSLPVSEYGIVWGTSASPTTANNKVQVGTSLAAPNSFTANVTGLPVSTAIYYRGYAINSSGTGYSTNGTFLTLANEPTVQASGVSIATRQNGNLAVSWTRGNGARCIVLVSASSPVDAPVDGSVYTANAAFGSGTQIGASSVAYLGTGTNVTLSALTAATTYYVAVYELNGSGGSENYLAAPATGSQTTVANPVSSLTWNGAADSNWNNTNNWDLLQIPDVGTPAIVPNGTPNDPVYSNQMAVASFGSLTQAGNLNINTNGFNSGAVLLNRSTPNSVLGAQLFVNANGVMNVAGNVALSSNSVVTVVSGGSLTASGQLIIGSTPTGGTSTGNVGSYGTVTNNGGTLNVGSTLINGTGFALTSSSKSCLLVINGGTNNLGSVTIKRSTAGSSFASQGSEGLVIYAGLVNMTGLDVGGGSSSYLSAIITGGIVTNKGSVLISQATSGRGSRLLQTGGLFVVTNLVNPNPTVAGTLNIYSVTGGTNIVGGVAFGTGSSQGNVYFTNGAVMYVGSQGITTDGSVTLSATLNGGSLLGATADWTGSAPLQLGVGTEIIQAADMDGTPHNITISGVLSGSGALTKTGNGTLTLNAADTYSGDTLISAGKLALGASGTLNSSGQIIVGSGATYDVQAASGYTVPAAKSLGGLGAVLGNVSFASTANLTPGTSTAKGALTFSNDLALTGTAITFEFTSNPSSPDNDLVKVVGTLNVSGGGNIVDVVGAGPAGNIYPLFKYGTLNGNLSNISLTSGAGSVGFLTNDTSVIPNMIAYVVTKTVHSSTNVVWVGNQANNVWDSLTTTNWLLNGALDYFINGDSAIFNNTGQVNSNVVLNATLLPATTTVATAGDYVFTGSGGIGGVGGITKTNTGRLYIQNTNSFTGGVSIKQGMVSVSSLADDNTPSPLGQTGTLLVDGGALEYTGPSTSWTRPLTVGTNGGAISLPSGVSLTYSGSISGGGSLVKSDLGSLTLSTANSYSGGTYLNGGTLVLNSAGAVGAGNIAFTGNSVLSLGTFTPANTIVLSNYSGVIKGGNSGSIKNVTGSSNLVIAVTSGVFDLAGDMSAYSGTITCSNAGGATVRLNGSTGSKLATWDTGSGTMDLAVRNKSTSPYFFGALMGGPSSTLTGPIGSDSGGHGPATYQIGDNSLNTIFEGVIKNGSDSSQVLSIVKVGAGTLTLSGANTYTGTTTVSNGTLLINGNSSSANGAVTIAGGTLGGIGTIGGATTFNTGATLEAGVGGIGALTFSSSLTLDAASTNKFVVTTAGGVSNSIVVNGQLSPNGSVIKITSGTPLAVGTYTLFNYSGGISGSFNPTPVFDITPTDTASIVDTGSQINLVIGTPAGPSFSSITTSGNDITLNAAGGTPGGSVTVLTSTDLTLPLASWTVVTTGNFDGSGNYSYTVTDALISGQPQQFYILQMP